MDKIYIKHHLGLGDTIVHNGLIRKIAYDNPNSQIFISAKHENYDNINFMFRDNDKITVNKVSNNNFELDIRYDINTNNYNKIISSYLIDDPNISYGVHFDDAFYIKANINTNIKKELFYIERDFQKEKNIFDELITSKNITDYVFLHEKSEFNIRIDRNKIKNNLPIIYAEKKYGIFELLTVMERAKECHLISSSFLSLMTCKKYNENIYAHMYCDRKELSEYIKKNNIEVIL
jgi:hypothetical protein